MLTENAWSSPSMGYATGLVKPVDPYSGMRATAMKSALNQGFYRTPSFYNAFRSLPGTMNTRQQVYNNIPYYRQKMTESTYPGQGQSMQFLPRVPFSNGTVAW